MRRDRVALGALLLMLAAFVTGLGLLVRARYERGDGYPAGSSFRTDPLGTKALHDALDSLDSVRVARLTGPAVAIAGGRGTTILFLEIDDGIAQHDSDTTAAVEGVAFAGGRVVATLAGAVPADRVPASRPGGRPGAEPPPVALPLGERWGFATRPCADSTGDTAGLPWRGKTCFAALADAWRPIYSRGSDRLVIERPLGAGSLVLLADGYPLSNEALLFEPDAGALARLIGPAREVLFEESHLGVRDQAGIALLARRYHLMGVLPVLILLFALWVWWASSPLVPVAAAPAGDEAVTGREASAGLVNLLRRGLPAERLMPACLDEWRRSLARRHPDLATVLGGPEFARDAAGRDPVAAYRRARRIVQHMGGEHER